MSNLFGGDDESTINTVCMVVALITAVIFFCLMITFFSVGGVLANPNYQKVLTASESKLQEMPFGYTAIGSGFLSLSLVGGLIAVALIGCKQLGCEDVV